MKKHFRPLLGVAVIPFFVMTIACSDNNESSDNLKTNQTYLNQIPFVTGGDSEADMDFVLENELYENMENANVAWNYFDNLYNSSLQNSIKQDLSYIILCKKDLIGLVNNNPSDDILVNALKKHVDNLVETKYLGYTSLYYALDALKSAEETTYVKAKAAAIVQYASNDPFHPDMIAGGVSGVGSQELYDKFVDNYSYVSKIKTLK